MGVHWFPKVSTAQICTRKSLLVLAPLILKRHLSFDRSFAGFGTIDLLVVKYTAATPEGSVTFPRIYPIFFRTFRTSLPFKSRSGQDVSPPWVGSMEGTVVAIAVGITVAVEVAIAVAVAVAVAVAEISGVGVGSPPTVAKAIIGEQKWTKPNAKTKVFVWFIVLPPGLYRLEYRNS